RGAQAGGAPGRGDRNRGGTASRLHPPGHREDGRERDFRPIHPSHRPHGLPEQSHKQSGRMPGHRKGHGHRRPRARRIHTGHGVGAATDPVASAVVGRFRHGHGGGERLSVRGQGGREGHGPVGGG